MKGATVSTMIPASGDEVFALLHGYERRLEWDTLLCEARLTGLLRSIGSPIHKPDRVLLGGATRVLSLRDYRRVR